MSDLSGYKNIFKTTFLFGFVQVFNIFVKVGINKVVAILLGTAGMGVISLFQYAVSFLSVSCGLGINQSSIRDISEARERGENSQIDLTVSFIKSIIRYTSLLGVVDMSFASSQQMDLWKRELYVVVYRIIACNRRFNSDTGLSCHQYRNASTAQHGAFQFVGKRNRIVGRIAFLLLFGG